MKLRDDGSNHPWAALQLQTSLEAFQGRQARAIPDFLMAMLEKRLPIVESFGIAALAGILGSVHLVYPFGVDQGEYGYAATAMLAGKTLYRDIFSIKPPATHLLHLAAILLFGKTMVAIRILDLLWQTATAFVLRSIAVYVSGRRDIGVAAAAIFLVAYFRFGFFYSAQTDGFLNLPVAIAVLTFLVGLDWGARLSFVASGLAMAGAVLFKYPIGILLILFGALLFWRGRYIDSFWLAVGFGAGLLACISWLAIAGGLWDFFSTFKLLPRYSLAFPGRTPPSLLEGLSRFLKFPWFLFLSAFLIALWSYRNDASQRNLVLLAWWFAAAFHLISQMKFWEYQWIPLLAPSALLLAAAVVRACDAVVRPPRRRRLVFALLAVGSLGSYSVWQYSRGNATILREVVFGHFSLNEAYRHFTTPRYSIAFELDLAHYLHDHTEPNETLFVWGYHPAVYFTARRMCASRFTFDFFLNSNFGWSRLYWDDLLADLNYNKPRYIVIAPSHAPLIDGLKDLLGREYALERQIEGSDLYRRTESDKVQENQIARARES